MALDYYFVCDGLADKVVGDPRETEWDGIESVLVRAASTEEALEVAALYDAGRLQAESVWDPALAGSEPVGCVSLPAELTQAEKIAALLHGDGGQWKSDAGTSFVELCERYGASRERRGDIFRHVFPDGSAIVEAPGGWDLEGTEPFTWRG